MFSVLPAYIHLKTNTLRRQFLLLGGLGVFAIVISMVKYKITIEVVDILNNGKCSMEQKVGDAFNYPEDRGKMCPSAFHIIYPWILVMQSGGNYSFFEDDGNSVTLGCSDYDHQVVFKIKREPVDD